MNMKIILVFLFYPFFYIINICKRLYWAVWKYDQKKRMISCGTNVIIGNGCSFTPSHIKIGNDVSIGDMCSFIATISNIYIGNKVMFAPNVTIRGGNHRTDLVGRYMFDIEPKDKLPENDHDVYIEDDVWIGCNVTILSGVRIGKGSIIGAGSVVVKDVPDYTIHVGVHDTFEKERFTKSQIIAHEALLKKQNV